MNILTLVVCVLSYVLIVAEEDSQMASFNFVVEKPVFDFAYL